MQSNGTSPTGRRASDFSIEFLATPARKEVVPQNPGRGEDRITALSKLNYRRNGTQCKSRAPSQACGSYAPIVAQVQAIACGQNLMNHVSQPPGLAHPLLFPLDTSACFYLSPDLSSLMHQADFPGAPLLSLSDMDAFSPGTPPWTQQRWIQLLKQTTPMFLRHFETEVNANNGVHLQQFPKPKRNRTAFSPFQLVELERAFESNHYVVGSERRSLASRLQLSETQVKVWFQNRRTKHKRGKCDKSEEQPEDFSVNNIAPGMGGNNPDSTSSVHSVDQTETDGQLKQRSSSPPTAKRSGYAFSEEKDSPD